MARKSFTRWVRRVPAAAKRDRRARQRARVTRAMWKNASTATTNHSISPFGRPCQPVII